MTPSTLLTQIRAELEGAERATPETLSCCPFCDSNEIVFRKTHAYWKGKQSERSQRIVAVCCVCGAQGPAFGPMSMTGNKTAALYWNYRPKQTERLRALAVAVQGIADAPHEVDCAATFRSQAVKSPCDCYKSRLLLAIADAKTGEGGE